MCLLCHAAELGRGDGAWDVLSFSSTPPFNQRPATEVHRHTQKKIEDIYRRKHEVLRVTTHLTGRQVSIRSRIDSIESLNRSGPPPPPIQAFIVAFLAIHPEFILNPNISFLFVFLLALFRPSHRRHTPIESVSVAFFFFRRGDLPQTLFLATDAGILCMFA